MNILLCKIFFYLRLSLQISLIYWYKLWHFLCLYLSESSFCSCQHFPSASLSQFPLNVLLNLTTSCFFSSIFDRISVNKLHFGNFLLQTDILRPPTTVFAWSTVRPSVYLFLYEYFWESIEDNAASVFF